MNDSNNITDCLTSLPWWQIIHDAWFYILLAYLIGSILGAKIVGFFKRVDISKQGSGNVGATNALRTHGWGAGLSVLTIDVFKAVLVLLIIPLTLPYFFKFIGHGSFSNAFSGVFILCEPTMGHMVNAQLSKLFLMGIAVILGHMFPIWHKFKGGKGVATMLGATACLYWPAVIGALVIWLLTVLFTGLVSMGSLLAAGTIAIVMPFAFPTSVYGWLPTSYGLIVFALIIFGHRANIKRLSRGTESRMTKLMLFKSK